MRKRVVGYNMNKELKENVISYRVREFDGQNYIVESYTMQLQDERLSYTELNSDYYIRYNSYLKKKQQFQNYISNKCRVNGYTYEKKDDIEELNAFLATHYFMQKVSDIYSEDIAYLNRLSSQYMENYNALVRNSTGINIEKQLSKARLFLRNKIAKIECINVGQANFSIGYDKNNQPSAVFDIGIKSSKHAVKNRNYAKEKLGQIDGNGVVIISHYDFDHINGYRYINSAAADRIWILPQKRLSPSPAERNLLNISNPDNCIFLQDIDYSKTPFNPSDHILTIGNIEIYQGNAKKIDSLQSTNENARCLMCLVKKEKSILFPADCLYEEFPTNFKVDYLVVPHHCCFYDKPIKSIDFSQLKEMIIFAGPNNGYKHPDISHINELYASYKNIKCLMNHTGYCFDKKSNICCPSYIKLTTPSYKVTL